MDFRTLKIEVTRKGMKIFPKIQAVKDISSSSLKKCNWAFYFFYSLVADVAIPVITYEKMTISRHLLLMSCIFLRCFENGNSNIVMTDRKPAEKFE